MLMHLMLDAHRFFGLDPINAAFTPSLPHRSDRQQEKRQNATHEMRLFFATERRQSRSA